MGRYCSKWQMRPKKKIISVSQTHLSAAKYKKPFFVLLDLRFVEKSVDADQERDFSPFSKNLKCTNFFFTSFIEKKRWKVPNCFMRVKRRLFPTESEPSWSGGVACAAMIKSNYFLQLPTRRKTSKIRSFPLWRPHKARSEKTSGLYLVHFPFRVSEYSNEAVWKS